MIWLNAIRIADPSKLDIGIHRISKAQRTSSGRMLMEIVAIKRAITLEYELIAGPALEMILNQLESRVFHTLRYPDPQGGERTMTVYTGDITESAWYTVGGVRQWQGVRIGLIEQ
ncbi:MAG: hypothetical protein DDT21_02693 [Syntrophomonadaceae bacterium]|nr:hypothetical protein [Bacillota bacterium]